MHPLLCGCIFAVAICILCSYISSGGIVALCCAIVLSLLFVVPVRFSFKHHAVLSLIMALAMSLTSFLYCKYKYEPACEYSGKSVVVDCNVLSNYGEGDNCITAKAISVYENGTDTSVNFKVRIYTNDTTTVLPSTKIRALVDFYDIEAVDRHDSDGIYISGFADRFNVIEPSNTSSFTYKYYAFREKLKGLIDLGDPETTSFARAMILGDKSELSGVFISKFRAIGMSHVMAVSGMHLLFAVMFFELILISFGIDVKPRAVCSIVAILLFTFVTGFSVSCVRAAIMLTVYYAGILIGRISESVTSLSFSVYVILLITPYNIYDLSFIMSVCAVLGIVLITPILNKFIVIGTGFYKIDKCLKFIKNIFTVSLGATLACIPVQIIVFREVSLVSPIANVLLLLPVKALFYTCFLDIPFGFIGIFSPISRILYKIISKITNILYLFPLTSISSYNPFFYIIFTLFGVLIIGIYIYSLKFPKKNVYPYVLSYAALCVSFAILNTTVISGTARLEVVDVGNGNCNIITSGDTAVVIDCGGSDFGSVYESFNQLPVKRIETVALTHLDSDHVNYLDYLINSFEIGTIMYPEFSDAKHMQDVFDKAQFAGTKIKMLTEDESFTVLRTYTLTAFVESAYKTKLQNNTSAVYKFSTDKSSVLFTGDMAAPQEYAYLDYGQALDCDILVAAHHGASNSSIKPVLELFTPDYSVISVGENSNGHPSALTLNRLNEVSRVLRTDLNGDIIFKFDKKGYKLLN